MKDKAFRGNLILQHLPDCDCSQSVWPDSCSGSNGNVWSIDWISTRLWHNEQVSWADSKQSQQSWTVLTSLCLPMLWQMWSSTSHICSFTCSPEGATQGEAHIWGHVIHFIRGGWRFACVYTSDFLSWQRWQEVIFFSQRSSSHQALSGFSRAVTPSTQLGWQMLIVVPPVSEIYAVLLFITPVVLSLDSFSHSKKWW